MSNNILEGTVKEQNLVKLTLRGYRYEGVFLTEKKIGKIKLDDKFPVIWIHKYCWDGSGIIKDRKTGEEQKIFLNITANNYSPNELKDNIIYFNKYLDKQKITDYPAVIDLQLQIMYKKAQRKRGRKAIIHPEPLKTRDLIKKGFVV